MNFEELIRARFSVRDFSDKPVESKKLSAVLEAGRVAPTAKNNQPQRIFVLKSDAALQKIRALTRCAFNAPVVLVVAYDDAQDWDCPFGDGRSAGNVDAAIVCTHIMLAAQDKGLGTCWVGYFDEREVKKAFGFPENIKITALLPIGYPSESAAPSERHTLRKPLSETVTEL